MVSLILQGARGQGFPLLLQRLQWGQAWNWVFWTSQAQGKPAKGLALRAAALQLLARPARAVPDAEADFASAARPVLELGSALPAVAERYRAAVLRHSPAARHLGPH